jgi:flagellar export protein FliJ
VRFQFRLARVLRYVELREREKKTEVAVLIRELENLQLKKDAVESETRRLLMIVTDVNLLKHNAERVLLTRTEISKLDTKMVHVKESLELKQFELAGLGMRKKGLESLREKREKEFRLEENRRAQTRLDEAYRMSKLGK